MGEKKLSYIIVVILTLVWKSPSDISFWKIWYVSEISCHCSEPGSLKARAFHAYMLLKEEDPKGHNSLSANWTGCWRVGSHGGKNHFSTKSFETSHGKWFF